MSIVLKSLSGAWSRYVRLNQSEQQQLQMLKVIAELMAVGGGVGMKILKRFRNRRHRAEIEA